MEWHYLCSKLESKNILMETQRTYTLITGGSSGIGLALAKLFAKDGHNLILAARDQSELSKAQTQLKSLGNIDVITISKDLFHMEQADDLYREIRRRNLMVDVLVNNAGHGWYGKFEETELEMELSIIHLNICSLVILTKHFLKDMIERGSGKILNTSSIASKMPGAWQSVYHGTKAFVQSFSEAVRAEVKDRDIVITTLLPGPTDTDFFHKAGMEISKMYEKEKLADPADVAKEGYDALMKGDDMVVAGLKNKMQAAQMAITPDSKLAEKMFKDQQPKDGSQ